MIKTTFAAFALVVAATAAPALAAGPAGSDNPSLESFSGNAVIQQETRFQTVVPAAGERAGQFTQRLYNPSTEGFVGGKQLHEPSHGTAQMAEGRMDFDWVGEVEGGA